MKKLFAITSFAAASATLTACAGHGDPPEAVGAARSAFEGCEDPNAPECAAAAEPMEQCPRDQPESSTSSDGFDGWPGYSLIHVEYSDTKKIRTTVSTATSGETGVSAGSGQQTKTEEFECQPDHSWKWQLTTIRRNTTKYDASDFSRSSDYFGLRFDSGGGSLKVMQHTSYSRKAEGVLAFSSHIMFEQEWIENEQRRSMKADEGQGGEASVDAALTAPLPLDERGRPDLPTAITQAVQWRPMNLRVNDYTAAFAHWQGLEARLNAHFPNDVLERLSGTLVDPAKGTLTVEHAAGDVPQTSFTTPDGRVLIVGGLAEFQKGVAPILDTLGAVQFVDADTGAFEFSPGILNKIRDLIWPPLA